MMGKNNVNIYSLKKDGEIQLSDHFKVKEFACKDGSDEIKISDKLITALETIRNYFNKSVTISSGYRTSSYNKKVGGTSNSQHTKGKAADIIVKDIPCEYVQNYVYSELQDISVGFYKTFTHIDVRNNAVSFNGNSTRQNVDYTKFKNIESGENLMRYNNINEIPEYGKEIIQAYIKAGIIQGTGESLDLSDDMLRTIVIIDRAFTIYDAIKESKENN